MTRMKRAGFARYLDRDEGRCLHCGTTETLIPQHRANRGMGGSKPRETPSNIITLCAAYNGRIEADATSAEHAKSRGWKLLSWQNPAEYPVFDATVRQWFYLTDDYRRVPA